MQGITAESFVGEQSQNIQSVQIDDLVQRTTIEEALRTRAGYVRTRPGEEARKAEEAILINAGSRKNWYQHVHTDVQPIRDLGLYFLPKASVSGHCFVFCEDRFVLDGSVPTQVGFKFAQDERGLIEGVEQKFITLTRPALVIAGAGHFVWGHWLLDFLPRLALAQIVLGKDLNDFVVPLPSDTPGWVFNLVAFFCGVGREKFLPYHRGVEVVQCNDGICIPTYAHSNYFLHSYLKELYFTTPNNNNAELPTRICVSRRNFEHQSKSVIRSFKQRSYFEEVAKKSGFTIVLPETMDLRSQIDLFANAEVVVGEYGSGMHNTLFSKPGTMVAQFVMPNSIQSRIAGLCSHKSIFLFPDIDPQFERSANITLEVSEPSIDEFFNAVGQQMARPR
jgi:Glycosyltransferase 61